MKKILLLGLLAGLFSLGACTSAKVLNREPSENFSLSQYKTFNFFEVEAGGDSTLTDADYQAGIALLKREIARQLTLQGLQQSDRPDLKVNIGLVVKEKVQTRNTDFRTDAPRYVGQRRYSWKSEEVEVGKYKEGTATVHLVDNAANKMVWRGVVEDVIATKPEKREAQVTAAIAELFKDMP